MKRTDYYSLTHNSKIKLKLNFDIFVSKSNPRQASAIFQENIRNISEPMVKIGLWVRISRIPSMVMAIKVPGETQFVRSNAAATAARYMSPRFNNSKSLWRLSSREPPSPSLFSRPRVKLARPRFPRKQCGLQGPRGRTALPKWSMGHAKFTVSRVS